MLNETEKNDIASILKNAKNMDDSSSDRIGEIIHELLDSGRIEDIPEAVETYLSSAEINKNQKRQFIYEKWIVGPILNRYILPNLGDPLSKPVQILPQWSIDSSSRLREGLLNGMTTGQKLKEAADEIIAEVKAIALTC